MKSIRQAQAVVFHKGKVVLLRKRDSHFDFKKKKWVWSKKAFWRLPKGKLEKNESAMQGLKRELLEEIGVSKLSKPKKVYSYSYQAPKGTLRKVQTFALEAKEKPRLTPMAKAEGITRVALSTVKGAAKKLEWENERKALAPFLRQDTDALAGFNPKLRKK
ncbi:MAG: NUDIX hydrolase [Candidatus Norongarragalinales archaeon]